MSNIDWRIEGPEFAACNCNIGCPCQFGARPTHDKCHAVVCGVINRGHFGKTPLNGLRWAGVFAWPNAIHEGNGEVEVYVDERADNAQREALLAILSGQHSEPGANVFEIFSHTYKTVHPPIFAPIELDIDVSCRSATLKIGDMVWSKGESLRNPVSGAEMRARLHLPAGFEYTDAEFGQSQFAAKGKVRISGEGTHAHFAHLNVNGHGILR
jgi:hypothetical protein